MSTQQQPSNAAVEPAKTKAVTAPKVDWNKPTDKGGLEACGSLIAGQMAKVLPSHLKGGADRMIRALIMTCQSNPKLFNCTPISLFGSTMVAARLGLEIGGPLGHAYLIPFKDSATLIIGYKGLADLAWRSNNIVGISPGIVHEKDSFDYELGTQAFLRHKPTKGDRGGAELYYVCVRTKFSDISTFDVMTVQDAVAFRDQFATVRTAPDYVRKNSPWYDCDERGGKFIPFHGFHSMAQKSIFRKLAKLLPLSTEVARDVALATAIDEHGERGALQPYQENVNLLLGTADISPVHESPEGQSGAEPPPAAGGDQGGGESASQKLKDRMSKKD